MAQPPFLALLALAGAWCLMAARAPGRWAVAVVWPSLAAIILISQRRLFPYQWDALTMCLSLLFGIALAEIMFGDPPKLKWSSARTRLWARRGVLLAMIPLLLGAGVATAQSVGWWVSDIVVARSYARYLRHFDVGTRFAPRINIQAADYLATHSRPTDTIFGFGLQPDLLLYSGRDSASSVSAFMLEGSAANPGVHSRLLDQLLGDLERHRPLYFVVADGDASVTMLKASAQALRDEPAVDRYVHQHYRQEITIGNYRLLRRRD